MCDFTILFSISAFHFLSTSVSLSGEQKSAINLYAVEDGGCSSFLSCPELNCACLLSGVE
ncbi:hypothetical protein BVRB_011560 [Beta vulgaris subsp. vulgaris]|uniref:Uncharacterized protein n=1 Tax=Beta vulgaris subsp. vulgaris TaxID=3555 RepID=A0A0J8B5K3_BETVV|nr:hypothetical protein BVRB_011560 [Beta vulgaris subsp. vulgaris]